MPNEYPKQQNYKGLEKYETHRVNVSFICLEAGTFIHIDAKGQAVEIKMDDEGRVGVCVSEGVAVRTFKEVYGE